MPRRLRDAMRTYRHLRTRARRGVLTAVLAIVVLACPATAKGGPAEVAYSSVEAFPGVAFKGGDPSKEVSVLAVRVGAAVPWILTDRIAILPGVQYELLDLGASDFPRPRIDSLQAASLKLGGAFKLTERAVATVSVSGGYASDFERGDGFTHFILTGSATGTYQLSSSFTVGAGLSYDSRTGSPALLPLLALDIVFCDRARLRGIVPADLEIEFLMQDWLTIGAFGRLEGNRYHLSAEKFGVQHAELAYSIYVFGPKVTMSPTPWLHVDAYASVASLRRFEALQDGVQVGSGGLRTGAMYGVRLWIGTLGWQDKQRRADDR